jgi:hypothetical protein
MDILDDEILQLWKLLHQNEVEYILVGGFAVNFHGYQRFTGDLDIWIKDTIVNRKKLRTAMEVLSGMDYEAVETMQFIPGWSAISLPSGFTFDIMTQLSGFPQEKFDECCQLASTAVLYDIPVKFLHYNQLIEAKKAAGRPKDLPDIEELEKLKKT